jgi:Septum formation
VIHPSRRHPWLVAGALAVLLAACGSSDDASPTADGGSAPASGSASGPGAYPSAETGETTSVFDLEVGDCFSAENDQLETVGVVPCDEEHEYEVFSVFDHEAGGGEPYPGDDELIAYADEACQPTFEEYVGADYQTSIWFITSLTPSAETWAVGDREIVCTVNQQDADEEPITVSESAAGSGE